MGKGYKHGISGGVSPLNFHVKTYPSETELKADKPKENTIGVITTTTMSSWFFSATEPKEPEVGMVWISVGTSSPAEFNALKGKTLQVYPLEAKQYVGGKFETVTAMSYQGGEWVVWKTYIVKNGVISDGYDFSGNLRSTNPYAVSQESGYLRIHDTYGIYGGSAISVGVDVTNISKLVLVCKIVNAGEPNQVGCGLGLAKALNATTASAVIANVVASQMRTAPGDYTLEIDVKEYSGVYYPCIWGSSIDDYKLDVYIYDFYYLAG